MRDGKVPVEASEVQVRAAALSPERVPERHHLLVDPERGGRLAPGDHDQAGASRPTRLRPGAHTRLRLFADAAHVSQMLLGIQDLLDNANPNSPAQSEAYQLYVSDKTEYKRRVRLEAQKNAPAAS